MDRIRLGELSSAASLGLVLVATRLEDPYLIALALLGTLAWGVQRTGTRGSGVGPLATAAIAASLLALIRHGAWGLVGLAIALPPLVVPRGAPMETPPLYSRVAVGVALLSAAQVLYWGALLKSLPEPGRLAYLYVPASLSLAYLLSSSMARSLFSHTGGAQTPHDVPWGMGHQRRAWLAPVLAPVTLLSLGGLLLLHTGSPGAWAAAGAGAAIVAWAPRRQVSRGFGVSRGWRWWRR